MYNITFKCKMHGNMNRGVKVRKFAGNLSHQVVRNFADVNYYEVVKVERAQ